jgi:restriction system protein
MWPTLQALRTIGGSGSNEEIAAKAIEIGGFTDRQQAVHHKDGPLTELEYRLAWARTYLGIVGALENSSRGVWSITDKGRALTQADMADIPKQARAERRRQRRAATAEEDDAETEADGNWKEQLLKVILSMPPDRFEHLSQRLLREAGFISVTVTGRSGDGGIDGVGQYRPTLVSFPVAFQSKRYRGSVGPDKVRELRGAMAGRAEKGLIITTGTFTADATREAARVLPAIDLIDGARLCDLLKQHSLGVRTTTRAVEAVEILPEFFAEI